jgi:hypothetical protein
MNFEDKKGKRSTTCRSRNVLEILKKVLKLRGANHIALMVEKLKTDEILEKPNGRKGILKVMKNQKPTD